jgi:hypothetical protein
MNKSTLRLNAALIISMIGALSGCVVATPGGYREGYYDRDHHRYYHEREWHDCGEHDDHCR